MGPKKRPDDEKKVDPETLLSNVQSLYKKLVPSNRAALSIVGHPKLAIHQKQVGILAAELKEIMLQIDMGTKGQHAVNDRWVKGSTHETVVELEKLLDEERDERAQLCELQRLIDTAGKEVRVLLTQVPTEADDLARIGNAENRLRQTENRGEKELKSFASLRTENNKMKTEITRLLVERNNFNIEWERTLSQLSRGKLYLEDILETSNAAFKERDEWIFRLHSLKTKSQQNLRKDIQQMQSLKGSMNHLSKLEEFLRVKGSTRVCEADEKQERARQAEEQRCRERIAELDGMLTKIFKLCSASSVALVCELFNKYEILNFSLFNLLCELLCESILVEKEVLKIRDAVSDQRKFNQERTIKQKKHIEKLNEELKLQQEIVADFSLNATLSQNRITAAISGIEGLSSQSKCSKEVLYPLLGPQRMITPFNVIPYLTLINRAVLGNLELSTYLIWLKKSMAPKRRQVSKEKDKVTIPKLEPVTPNPLKKLIDYLPCAYCVEDYLMNRMTDIPDVVVNEKALDKLLHLDEPNTRYGIYTLTDPAKRHPMSASKKPVDESNEPDE